MAALVLTAEAIWRGFARAQILANITIMAPFFLIDEFSHLTDLPDVTIAKLDFHLGVVSNIMNLYQN